MWEGLGLFVAGLLGGGCSSTDAHLKPPKPPEEYNAPSDKDSRYTSPIAYPKDSLDKDVLMQRAKDAKDANGPGGPRGMSPRFSGGAGGGGGGY
jgi:hypothetical protein